VCCVAASESYVAVPGFHPDHAPLPPGRMCNVWRHAAGVGLVGVAGGVCDGYDRVRGVCVYAHGHAGHRDQLLPPEQSIGCVIVTAWCVKGMQHTYTDTYSLDC
jgi:hypothetical protein